MNQHSVIHLRYIFLGILLVTGISSCDSQTSVTNRIKPAAVPDNAIWTGSADGGVYVVITRTSGHDKQIYSGTIYFENGEQWYKGKMRLMPNVAEFDDIQNKDSYSGWDGEILYLSNGRMLNAMKNTD